MNPNDKVIRSLFAIISVSIFFWERQLLWTTMGLPQAKIWH